MHSAQKTLEHFEHIRGLDAISKQIGQLASSMTISLDAKKKFNIECLNNKTASEKPKKNFCNDYLGKLIY